jgi:hypothetical protein
MSRLQNNRCIFFLLMTIGICLMAAFITLGKNHLRATLSVPTTTPGQTPAPVKEPVSIGSLVADDMPLTIQSAKQAQLSIRPGRDGKVQELSEIRYVLQARGTATLNAITLVALEYNSSGRLVRADGYQQRLDAVKFDTGERVLSLGRNVPADNSLVLTVERASGDSSDWQSAFRDLAAGGSEKVRGGAAKLPPSTARSQVPPEGPGGDFCYQVMCRAQSVKEQGQVGIGGVMCNQQERSWILVFSSLTPAKPPDPSPK